MIFRLQKRHCESLGHGFWISPNGEAISMRQFRKKYLLWKNIFDPELSHTYRFPIWGNPKPVSQTFAMAFLKLENHDFSEIHEK